MHADRQSDLVHNAEHYRNFGLVEIEVPEREAGCGNAGRLAF